MRHIKRKPCGLVILLPSLLLVATGCDQIFRAPGGGGGAGAKKGEPSVSYVAASSKGMDVSSISEELTEENALKAYFKGKKLLSMAYFARSESRAKQYSAEAERCFENSLRFYVPDIKVMAAGKKPVHASANWEFLKGLHEAWSDAIKLSGKRLSAKDQIDGNARDAWALSVISHMAQDVGSEEKRREMITERFSAIRDVIEENDKYAENLFSKKQAAAGKRPPEKAWTTSAVSSGKDRMVKPSAPKSPAANMAKAGVTAPKSRPEGGFIAGDPLAGATALSIKTPLSQTGLVVSVAKQAEPAEAGVRVAADQPNLTEKKNDTPPAIPKPAAGGDARAEFKQTSPSAAKLYVGDRLQTLPASPGKLYIGGRVHTLSPQDNAQPPVEK